MDRLFFYVPECFWELDNAVVVNCNCKKIFFDVVIDFVDYKIIICKDWYVMQVRAMQNGLSSDNKLKNLSTLAKYSIKFDTYSIKYIQENLIKNIIKKYFKTPILDKLIMNDNANYLNPFLLNFAICDRPFIHYKLNMLKIIEYYIYETKYESNVYSHHIDALMNNITAILHNLCLTKFAYAKYKKLRPLISKLKNYSDGIIATELILEIYTELVNLKIK